MLFAARIKRLFKSIETLENSSRFSFSLPACCFLTLPISFPNKLEKIYIVSSFDVIIEIFLINISIVKGFFHESKKTKRI